MSTVTTVLGEVPASELGVVLPHEHLISLATDQWAMPEDLGALRRSVEPVTLDRRGAAQLSPFEYRAVMQHVDIAVTVDELAPFTAAGGRTVVDMGVPGFGRDPMALRAVALLSGVHVVMGCGEYTTPSHSSYVRGASRAQIADVLVRELTEGVGPRQVRAGVIGEIGISNPMTDDERKIVLACADAHRATGAGVNLHRTIYPDAMAVLEAVDTALDAGVAPHRLAVSHCDERPEPELPLAVAERGCFVEFDTFGMEQWAANWAQRGAPVQRSWDHHRIALLELFAERGLLGQVLLSQDVAMRSQLVVGGGWGYAHLSTTIEPRLLAAGFSATDVELMRVVNPRRFLAGC